MSCLWDVSSGTERKEAVPENTYTSTVLGAQLVIRCSAEAARGVQLVVKEGDKGEQEGSRPGTATWSPVGFFISAERDSI